MILQSKTRNLQQLNHLHHALISMEQTILQKNVGVVPMKQIDINGANKSIQQTIELIGKTTET